MSDPVDGCLINLRFPGLWLDIESEGEALPVWGDETLDSMLDATVGTAAYEGNWADLVILRECLLKWAQEAESALRQIAKDGPARDSLAALKPVVDQ